MTKNSSAESVANQHRRTRTNLRQAGVVSVLLHLPPALAGLIDQERGKRPRTAVALNWLMAHARLEPEAVQPTLPRGRPRKVVEKAIHDEQVPILSESLTIEPVSLQIVDWAALHKKVPAPRREPNDLPDERKCWRLEGSDGLTRLRWLYRNNDPRIPYIKELGAKWEQSIDYFAGRGAWVLPPCQADRCVEKFQLVDLQPLKEMQPKFGGWCIDVVDCGSPRGVLMEARVDFGAALSAAAKDPALALGLAMWLESRRESDYRWYQVKATSGDLAKGMLICEPLRKDELLKALSSGLSEIALEVRHHEAPPPWRKAWATVILQGHETPEGLVRPEPHSGCPGHRVGSLFTPFLAATAADREPLLLHSEWNSIAERAQQFGVVTKLVPKPPSNLARAFDPAKVPGWSTAARGGQQLFEFQREAVSFALDQDLRCLIGDEMGLGKTASAIAAVHAAGLKRVLVVCPLNAVGVWQREIVAWSNVDHSEPKVVVIRATDEAPVIEDAEWVLIGYETLAGRDERIEVECVRLKNALCAFFKKAFGHGPDKGSGYWNVSERWKADTNQLESKGTRWAFIIRADPQAAEPLQKQLLRERGSWLTAKLRQRLERVAARLGRPVATTLQAWNPELIVTDEAHRVKAVDSRRTQAVRAMCEGRRMLLLTGTPLRNHAADAKALLEIILPERIWKVMDRENQGIKEVVKDLLARRMIRRRKKDVLTQLPPKLRQRIPVRVEAAKLEAYAAMMHQAEERFAAVWQETGSLSEARKAAQGFWSQARRELGLAKLDTGVPIDYIREVIAAKSCAIVFAHHLEVLTRLERMLEKAGIRVGRVDGRTKPAERTSIIHRFQQGEIQVFLGGLLAAGEAITLTRADTVIFAELAWVPGELLQAEDRGHRVGQKAPKYHVIHLVAEIVPPSIPKPPEGLERPIPLPESMPRDMKKFEKTGVESRALKAARSKLMQVIELWETYDSEREQTELLASAENIDQHMIDALDAKIAHIDEVLGEDSGAMIANDGGKNSGVTRLAQATQKRVQSRRGGTKQANDV